MLLFFKLIVLSSLYIYSILAMAQTMITPPVPPEVQAYRKNIVVRANLYPQPPLPGKGLRIALFQNRDKVNSTAAIKYNIDQLKVAVQMAKQYGVQVISFPEIYLTGYSLNAEMVRKWAEFKDGPGIKQIQDIAKQFQMNIIIPYPEKATGKDGKMHYYDSIGVINEHGQMIENWRKTTVFGFEDRIDFRVGDGPYKVIKVNDFPIGVLNCYEGEFLEHHRILALKGAKLIVVPNATYTYGILPNGESANYPDVAHILMPAYAFANNTFVAFSNHVGFEKQPTGGDRIMQGNSLIAGPDGKIIIEAKHHQNTLLITDVIPEAYAPNHPSNANYLRDRRPNLYHELIESKVEFDGGYTYPVYPAGEYDYPGLKQIEEKEPSNH